MTRSTDAFSRRAFLAALAATALPARSQLAKGRRARVACLTYDESSVAGLRTRIESGLAAAGLPNPEVRCFTSTGEHNLIEKSVREAVAWAPDAIIVPGPPLAMAARDATQAIPVVFFAVPDPEALGLVRSLARPGGNVTGIALNAAAGVVKRLELVRELLPSARRVASLFRRPQHVALIDKIRREVAEAAGTLKLRIEDAEVGAGGRGLGATLAGLERRPPDAVLPFGPYAWEPGGVTVDAAKLLMEFERRTRVLVLQEFDYAVKAGATAAMYDGGSQLTPAIATLARILKGASPADTPVELPLAFMLAINRSGARAIGLTIPPTVLIRADVVVE